MNQRGGAGSIDVDTPRVRHLTPAEQAWKTAERAAARRNLATMICRRYGIDPAITDPGSARARAAARDFAQLAELLGLDDVAERPPGTCRRCWQPMSTSGQTKNHARRDGLCTSCARKAST